jgi:hypothetical protein
MFIYVYYVCFSLISRVKITDSEKASHLVSGREGCNGHEIRPYEPSIHSF